MQTSALFASTHSLEAMPLTSATLASGGARARHLSRLSASSGAHITPTSGSVLFARARAASNL